MFDLTGVTVTGADPVLPGRFKVGELAATCVGATTLAAAGLLRERSGVDSDVAVDALEASDSRDSVAARIRELAAIDVESLVQQAGGAAGALRTRSQWLAHPQARLLGQLPVVQLERFGDAPPSELPAAERPPRLRQPGADGVRHRQRQRHAPVVARSGPRTPGGDPAAWW